MAFRAHPTLGTLLLFTMLACASAPSSPTDSRSGGRRPMEKARLEALVFESASPKRSEAIELCLPPALRLRQWNVEDHPFRVELGKVTAREFERLVKSIFADVTVTFERRCGGRSGLPWITTEIRSANREVYYEIEDDLQYTAITLVTSIHEPDGRERWVETTESVVAAPPALGGYGASWGRSGILEILFPPALAVTDLRLAHASREFGRAIEQGLREIDQNLRRLDGLSADSRLIPGDQEGPEA